MVVTQTVDIPASHRLTIEVPREVPAGRVILAFMPEGDESYPEKTVICAGEQSPTPHLDFLSGILAGAGNITLEQIREERLSKYL